MSAPRKPSTHDRAEALAATFLDLVASGLPGVEAAESLGLSVRSFQRFARASPQFSNAFGQAKLQGKQARKAMRPVIATRPLAPPKVRKPPKPKPKPDLGPPRKPGPPGPVPKGPVPKVSAPPAPVYLERLEPIPPEGLKLNEHLPPLSARTHLAKLQEIMYSKEEPPTLRNECTRQLGMYFLGPSMMRAASRAQGGSPAEPAQIGTGAPQVLLMAPDNGLYAPGCEPAEGADAAEVVDGAEAEGAELVALVASGEE